MAQAPQLVKPSVSDARLLVRDGRNINLAEDGRRIAPHEVGSFQGRALGLHRDGDVFRLSDEFLRLYRDFQRVLGYPHDASHNPTSTSTNIPTNSPEDQKILEDEFSRNPKPDKASRLEIIKKVALGEKEIQVRGVP